MRTAVVGAVLAAGVLLAACGPGVVGLTGPAHTPDPDHPGYQRYQDGGPVGGHVTGVRLSGQMTLTVRAGSTASVHRTVDYQDRDPGGGTWRTSGDTIDLNGCTVPHCMITYDVTVPAGTALTGELDSGSADVRGIGSVDLTARSDTVGIQQVSGAVKLNAASTTTTLTGVGGQVSATVESGTFTARDLRAALNLKANSASVIAQGVAAPVTLDGRSAQVTLGVTSANDVSATVTSGSMTITVPRSAYHVVSTTDSAELDSAVPDDPAGQHRITLTLTSAQASLNYA